MLPFFRKIRYRLAKDNQFFKYSRYAIGEIALVMVGILLALYVNNWNEQRKEREKFDQVLIEVEKELIMNIENCRMVLSYLHNTDSILRPVLFDSVGVEFYQNNYPRNTRTVFYRMLPKITENSYSKLLEINGLSRRQESIKEELIGLYLDRKEPVDGSADFVHEVAVDNMSRIKNYPWYKNWVLSLPPSKEMLDYFVHDPEYMNSALEYTQATQGQLSFFLERFEIDSRRAYLNIHRYLQSVNKKNGDTLLFSYDAQEFKHYIGTFERSHASRDADLEIDSIVISLEKDKLFYSPYYSDGRIDKREIIPVTKYYFRTEYGRGFYQLDFDESENVVGHTRSNGISFMYAKKIR